ncbi:MAG TPA: class I SAM-dependent methyltransferase [Actinomycetota bacterium]|nr:class I SAM-dependent methyltransferase [Actinomycetota bacterium]
MTDSDARMNRAAWDRDSDDYQREHHSDLSGERRAAWGVFRILEDRLRILGDVRGKEVLELGCGGAQWAVELAARGAHVVGLDNSSRQLEHARRLIQDEQVDVVLVQAAAEQVPFAESTFDIVFCDYGALTFADPAVALPEVARILRQGGLLAFTTLSPFFSMCFDDEAHETRDRLLRPYFGLGRDVWEDAVDYTPTYADWFRLFASNGFDILDLLEPRPEQNTVTSYQGRPVEWSRRWPAELLWRVRLR